jgi:hypothetical protein
VKKLSERPHDPATDDPLACCDFCFKGRMDPVYEGGIRAEPTPFFAITFDDDAGQYWVCETCMKDGTLEEEMEAVA